MSQNKSAFSESVCEFALLLFESSSRPFVAVENLLYKTMWVYNEGYNMNFELWSVMLKLSDELDVFISHWYEIPLELQN